MLLGKNIIFFILIVALASILRLWQLGHVPPSPDWDEAALGYNAYSIRETGKDEYGVSFPIILRSFDDYKPAMYSYFVIPFITLFGLNVFAVRLVSALFGIATVIAVYFLIHELFRRWEIRGGKPDRDVRDGKKNLISHLSYPASHLPLLTSLLLAISPWHIQFSRIAFESNVGVAFNVFTALFFLKGLKKPVYFTVTAILAGINIYVYQSEKVFTPLLLLALILIFRNELFKISKKYLITSLVVGVIISLPLVFYTITNKEGLSRAKGVSVFSDQTQFLRQTTERLIEDKKNNDVVGLVFDNRRAVFVKSIISGYLSHFDLNWLFITGDLARHHAPHMGLLYLFELPFLFIGMYFLLFNKALDRKMKLLIFSWFLIAPIPASITSGVPHAVRTLNFLPTFQIFTAIGIITTINAISNINPFDKLRVDAERSRSIKYQISNIQIKYLIPAMFFLFSIFNFLYYLNQYFVQQNYFNSSEWQYGYEPAISEIQKIEEAYDKIIVSNEPHMDQSYIFFLFYLKYKPVLYQEEAKNVSGGFAESHAFGKFEFRPIVWEKEKKNPKMLYVGRPNDFPESAEVIKTIYFLDKKPAIKIVKG